MKLVRSVSGTWHAWEADRSSTQAITRCQRLVRVGGWVEDWRGAGIRAGARICCDCQTLVLSST